MCPHTSCIWFLDTCSGKSSPSHKGAIHTIPRPNLGANSIIHLYVQVRLSNCVREWVMNLIEHLSEKA